MNGSYGLGVDLGTTYTSAAVFRDGRAQSVPLGQRAHTVPSVLFMREDGAVLVGEAAVRRGITEPEQVAREFKRRFGDGVPLFLGDREVTAEELSGQLLRWVVDTVAEREGGRPTHVTLTHPVNWGDHRRRLLVAAAETAGLTDVGLLPEPVAAAAYHASTDRLDRDALMAVYDLGGGTFDATVVRKTRSGFAVQGKPVGDDGLGGIDFDQAVMAHVSATVGVPWQMLDPGDPAVFSALAQIREHAVDAKEALSADVEASVPVILPGISREVRITRGELESAIRIPVLRTVDLLAQAIEAAGATPDQIRSVLLIGGSSRIPLVSRLIASELRIAVAVDAHPKFAVCLGAAIAAGARLAPQQAQPPGPPPGWQQAPPQPAWPPTGPPAGPPPGFRPGPAPGPSHGPQPVPQPAWDPSGPTRALPMPSSPVRPPGTGTPGPGSRPGEQYPPAAGPGGPPASGPYAGDQSRTVSFTRGSESVDPSPPAPAPGPAGPVDPMAKRSAPLRKAPAPLVRPEPVARGAEPAWAEPSWEPSWAGPGPDGPSGAFAAEDGSVAVKVDLTRTGITEMVDIAVHTEPDRAPSWAPVLIARDEPLTVTHRGDRRRGSRAVVLTVLVAVLVLAAVAAAALFLRPDAGDGSSSGSSAVPTADPESGGGSQVTAAGAAVLVPEPVTTSPGEAMHAVAVGSSGVAVAVGGSTTEETPRAWRSSDGGSWEPATVTAGSNLVGGMSGVAEQDGRFVAVGWVSPAPAAGASAGSDRLAAVWTSRDGRTWTLGGAGDLGTGSPDLGELYDVVAAPDGGFLASGVDRSADPANGDGAVLRSGDGLSWELLPVSGLDGPGPTTLRRLLPVDQGFAAVGSTSGGGSTVPVVWTSPDGETWSEAARLSGLGPGGSEATGLALLPDGRLLVTGSATDLGGSTVPALWVGSGPEDAQPWSADVTVGALDGVASLDGRVTAVGSVDEGSGPTAAAWTVEPQG